MIRYDGSDVSISYFRKIFNTFKNLLNVLVNSILTLYTYFFSLSEPGFSLNVTKGLFLSLIHDLFLFVDLNLNGKRGSCILVRANK